MSKYTKGPWTADRNENGGYSIRPHRKEDGGKTGFQLAYLYPPDILSHYKGYGSSIEKDALLISKAPEMYEALKLLNRMGQQRFKWKRDYNEDAKGWLSIVDITRQAIAKAEEV